MSAKSSGVTQDGDSPTRRGLLLGAVGTACAVGGIVFGYKEDELLTSQYVHVQQILESM